MSVRSRELFKMSVRSRELIKIGVRSRELSKSGGAALAGTGAGVTARPKVAL